MISFTTRVAIPMFIGIAFGFFISCSVISPDKTNNPDEELSQRQLEERIQEIDEQIESNDPNPNLLFSKGELLSKLARKYDDPSDRTSVYSNLRQSLVKARSEFENAGNQSGEEEANQLLNVTWSNEHNSGVRLMQQDTTQTNDDFERAAEHFNNATVIIPDSSISYEMQARAYYKLNQQDKAIEILERARQNIEPLPSSLLEQLAYLYLENNEIQKAVSVYEEAKSVSDEDLNLIHGLANAYISKNDHQKAVELLNLLIENKPESVLYAQTLGTELYHLAAAKIDAAIAKYEKDSSDSIDLLPEVDSLLTKAENQFKESLKVNPDDYELERSFAYFYQNSASKYQQLLPYLSEDKANFVNDKIQYYLRSSIPLFLKLAEQNPQERNFLKNLYDIYIYLGMDEKAAETKEKLN